MKVLIRGITAVFLTVSLLVLAFYSIRIVWAEMFYLNGVAYLEHWSQEHAEKQQNFTVAPGELEQAEHSFQRAIRLGPDNPRYLLQASKLHYWQDRAENYHYLGHKEDDWGNLRTTILMRPAWPYGWLSLALSKSRHSVIDGEFSQALLQAMLLGPREPDIRKEAVRLGSYYDHWLDESVRQAWKEQVERMAIRQRNHLPEPVKKDKRKR
ncbi:hypothetical protein CI610_01134 [invertebrate metagenome]|uniref:Tetratricopeptide repeat protein n=1 Tax=invertebrate metagenome TaxID=1711999 RepID=A0A2H9T9K3_9ZZZZ